MAVYWVNRRQADDGDHEVHKDGCIFMPSDRERLGEFASCDPAVNKATALGYSKANGCKTCCPACHK